MAPIRRSACLEAMLDELHDAFAESWESFCSLDFYGRRMVLGSVLALIFLTIFAWKVMVALILFAIGTTIYLRLSDRKNTL
jgi:uncharacterized membrane protein